MQVSETVTAILYSTDKHRVVSASSYDVHTTVSHAQDVFKSGVWSKAPAIHRSTVLSNLARLLQEKIGQLAMLESMQTGRAIREMQTQLSRLPEWL